MVWPVFECAIFNSVFLVCQGYQLFPNCLVYLTYIYFCVYISCPNELRILWCFLFLFCLIFWYLTFFFSCDLRLRLITLSFKCALPQQSVEIAVVMDFVPVLICVLVQVDKYHLLVDQNPVRTCSIYFPWRFHVK